MRSLVGLAFCLLLSTGHVHAADHLLIQQAVPADQAGRPWLMVDRAAVTSVVVEKGQDLAHRASITFHPDARPRFVIQCNDSAVTRELMEALRQGGPGMIDVSGRCRF